MDKVIVLCNVGSRDLSLDGQLLRPVREKGKQVLEHYNAFAPRLDLPIILPCLRYILKMHPTGIERLVLFGTDQPESPYRQSDTLHVAEVAVRLVKERLGEAVSTAEHRLIRGINPALYDEAFELYDAMLADLHPADDEICYAIIAGGIPACNTALLFQGTRYWGARLRVIYQPQGGEPQELRIGQQLMETFREAAAIEHLKRLDFANAMPYLETAHPGLKGLVTFAAQRLAFDFDLAQRTLREAMREGNRPTRDFIEEHLRHALDDLEATDGTSRLVALLRELYWNAVITYRHHHYVDFTGRVYRFQEALLRYLVETIFGFSTDLSPQVRERTQEAWVNSIQANEALHKFLEGQWVGTRKLDWTEIGRPTYQALLSYAIKKEGLRADGRPFVAHKEIGRYRKVLDEVNKLDPIIELRHRSIIGHGFQGISQALLKERCGGESPPDKLARPLKILGLLPPGNPYDAIADFVIHSLRRL